LDGALLTVLKNEVSGDGLLPQPSHGSAERAMAVALVNKAIGGSIDAIKIVRSVQCESAPAQQNETLQVDIQVVE